MMRHISSFQLGPWIFEQKCSFARSQPSYSQQ